MARAVCKLLGLVLLLAGVAGFGHLLTSLGAHLTPTHNAVHVVSGIAALYFGFAGSAASARTFCLLFGLVYLALGILGVALAGPDHLWHFIDGKLMFGKIDNSIHMLLGVVFLAGGLFAKNR